MGTLYQSLRRWFGNVGSTGQQDGIQFGEPFTKVYDRVQDYGIDGALQVSAVWSSVELLTDNIASLPLFVYLRATGQEGHKTLARDTQLWQLLHESPNRRHTPIEFWQYMTMNFLMRGNAYARLIRNEAGEVIEMWPLSSDQVEVEVLKDRSVIYKYSYEGQIAVYNEASILHWRDKGNGIIGMSRLDYMRSSVGLAIDAQNHSRNTFRKSGKRPGVFMIDKLLTKEQRDAIRANYSGLIEGSEDDLLVLEAGAKFEALSMSPVDLQMMETRRFSVEDIARWFGIPSVMINDTAKTTTWGTGIEQIIEGFYKFRLRPMLEGLEQAIERRVLTPRQRQLYTVEFSLEAILRGSYLDRLEAGSKGVQNGLITRNEWRQLENLPPIQGGDDLTAQVNLAPIGMLGQTSQGEERSAKVIEMLTKSQKNVESALQAMLSREQKPINLAINPSIDVQTPEVKMDLQITNEKTVTKKHLSLVRDENGKVLGAESIEE
jgi:HK97 family phage portal protein